MSSLSSTLVAGFTVVTLGVSLTIAQLAHGSAESQARASLSGGIQPASASPSLYVRSIQAILNRYDVARREGDNLLTERDADPRLAGDARWREEYGLVVQEHQNEYVEVQHLSAPPDAEAIQQCFTDGLRLTATAESMFSDAFGADGHRAYYLSAHGNWDLNLGKTTLGRCRESLAVWQAKLSS